MVKSKKNTLRSGLERGWPSASGFLSLPQWTLASWRWKAGWGGGLQTRGKGCSGFSRGAANEDAFKGVSHHRTLWLAVATGARWRRAPGVSREPVTWRWCYVTPVAKKRPWHFLLDGLAQKYWGEGKDSGWVLETGIHFWTMCFAARQVVWRVEFQCSRALRWQSWRYVWDSGPIFQVY